MKWVKSKGNHYYHLTHDNGDPVYLPNKTPREWDNYVTLLWDGDEPGAVGGGSMQSTLIGKDEYTWIFRHPDEWYMEQLL